jgi:hypothetical protein
MNTLSDIKARFHELQLEMGNLVSLMAAEILALHKKQQEQESKSDSAPASTAPQTD